MAGKTPGYGPLNHGKNFTHETIDAQKGNQRDEMTEAGVYPGVLRGAIEINLFSPHPPEFPSLTVSGKNRDSKEL
jgi:hypothetical protein